MSVPSVSQPPRSPDPAAEALIRFRQIRFRHATLDAARAQLVRYLAPGMPPAIVMLDGSTAVGKTTLVGAMTRDLCNGLIGPSHPEPTRFVTVICPRPGSNGIAFDMGFWHFLAQDAGSPDPGRTPPPRRRGRAPVSRLRFRDATDH